MTAALAAARELTPPDRATLASFWTGQQALLADLLATAVPAGSTVALLDYPVHGNTGDHLIWRGTEQWLKSIDARIVGRWHIDNFTFPRLPSDTILVCQGGGNRCGAGASSPAWPGQPSGRPFGIHVANKNHPPNPGGSAEASASWR
jgi:hypothetical protein